MDSRRTIGDGSGGVKGGYSTDVRPFRVDTVMFDIAIFCRCDGDGGIYSCYPDDFAWNFIRRLPVSVLSVRSSAKKVERRLYATHCCCDRHGNGDLSAFLVESESCTAMSLVAESEACLRERRPRKPRQLWEDDTSTSSSDDDTSDIEIKSECADSDTAPGC